MPKEIIELVQYRNFLYRCMKRELRNCKIAERRELKSVGREIRLNSLREIQDRIYDLEDTFRKNGTFKSEEFADFLTQFLTLTETDTVKTSFRPTLSTGETKDITHYVICSPEIRDILKENVKTDIDLARFWKTKTNEDIIKISGDTVYPFNNNLKMSSQFRRHKRLKIAIYELMQLKIDNPEITDKERYEIVLNNTIKRNLRRCNNSSK